MSRELRLACRRCWWKESGRCFNDDLGEVPRSNISPITGKETDMMWRVGWEITDDHWLKCRANLAAKKEQKRFDEAAPTDKRILLLMEG